MPRASVIVGEFRRPAFAEGLMARLSDLPDLVTRRAQNREIAGLAFRLAGPLVVILDADLVAVEPPAVSVPLTTILIGEEGRNVHVHFRQIDSDHIADVVLVAARPAAADRRPRGGLLRAIRALRDALAGPDAGGGLDASVA